MATTTHTGLMEALTVGQVAQRYGVTVCTLHRLGAIITHRRLGMSLPDVQDLLDGESDVVTTLTRQKEAVFNQASELNALARAIDRILEAEMNDQPATDADLKEIFGEDIAPGLAAYDRHAIHANADRQEAN